MIQIYLKSNSYECFDSSQIYLNLLNSKSKAAIKLVPSWFWNQSGSITIPVSINS